MANQRISKVALEQHANRLGQLPHVVGLGIVPVGERKGVSKGGEELGIAVYVDEKVPLEELKKTQRVPRFVRVKQGGRAYNVYTKVIEQGPVSFEKEM